MQELFKDKEVTDLLIQLNTQNQLFNRGIDSDNKKLISPNRFQNYAYARNTVFGTKFYKGKLALGLPVDKITLKNTGDFYGSFKVILDSNNDFEITADTQKESVDLITEWGQNILGLTDESQAIFNDLVRQKVPQIIKSYIQQAA